MKRKYLITFLIISCTFLYAQKKLKQISENVFYKDTVLVRGDEVYNSFLFYNKAENIYIVSIDSLDFDDEMLSSYPSTIRWKQFTDPKEHFTFLYPFQDTVQKIANQIKPVYKIGQMSLVDSNYLRFQDNVLITLTSKTFEDEIEGLFTKDGDLWIIEGWGPMFGNYLFGQNIQAIYGERSVGVSLPEGGTAASSEKVVFIFVKLKKRLSAIIEYQGDITEAELMQVAKSIKVK